MSMEIQLTNGISLAIRPGPNSVTPYPSGRIQKGLILVHEGHDLSEEAVGFGVPVLKRGLQAIFPGAVELISPVEATPGVIYAKYTLNLVEKIERLNSGTLHNPLLYGSKNLMAALIRRAPPLRGALTRLSSNLRERFSWKTVYEPAQFSCFISMTYTALPGTDKIGISLEKSTMDRDDISEIVLMNEQGAHHFNRYADSTGQSLCGEEIGCWDEVSAGEASFISDERHISFTLPTVPGARLYRGRELVGGRLSWAGFGYSLTRSPKGFTYEIRFRSTD